MKISYDYLSDLKIDPLLDSRGIRKGRSDPNGISVPTQNDQQNEQHYQEQIQV